MIKKIFLIGNPNVGKSAVFSRLTGVNVVSANYPGTTVEILKGMLETGSGEVEVVDLPGTYSLEPSSPAEKVATEMLNSADKSEIAVINVVDSTNLERNIFLTLQLIESGLPVIVCLNMCDDACHRGIKIDADKLKDILGVPVIPTCAVTGSGIKNLIQNIGAARTISKTKQSYEERWKEIGHITGEVQQLEHRHHNFREMLEDISVMPATGFIIAAGVVYGAFQIVRSLGEFIINRITDPLFMDIYQPMLEKLTSGLNKEGFVFHLLIGDLIDGKMDFKQSLGLLTTAPYIEIGMVLPYVISFYFVLSILEDIGYLPRLAILLDSVMHRLGLHGYAVIPVLLGFGCNVPGILSTRILESKRERFIAATIISIGVPCVPLQAMIFGLLGAFGGFYAAGVYLVLLVLIIVLGSVLNRIMGGNSPEFLIEIPPLRMPPLSMLGKKLYFRIKGFLIEALPVVFAGVLLVNVLLYFKAFDMVTGLFAPVMRGLFGLPKESIIALIIGFFRKDVAVGMLMPLGLTVKQLFIATTLLAISFPCVATFMVLWKELGFKSLVKSTAIMIFISMLVGGMLNFIVFR
ncbi:MAG TPA: ferrous iron transporter B [Candidatus Omnitrophota bacterium]|nr:ferrous iron transporter B [Candidatus Omnitrophota bacterium]HPS20488.1 ferrous iron transporter B [Candidatus Omnitrophota bacterium]